VKKDLFNPQLPLNKGIGVKLYYCPGAGSLSAHIVAREAGIELKLEKVDLQTKKSGDGRTAISDYGLRHLGIPWGPELYDKAP
jgi:hypothetical protein